MWARVSLADGGSIGGRSSNSEIPNGYTSGLLLRRWLASARYAVASGRCLGAATPLRMTRSFPSPDGGAEAHSTASGRAMQARGQAGGAAARSTPPALGVTLSCAVRVTQPGCHDIGMSVR
jgi:hypothetical protein